MIGIFKENIEFITEHAVDPDKRRYATKHEAVRHYIDIDHWGVAPFDSVPRYWTDAIAQNLKFYCIDQNGDSSLIFDAREAFWGKPEINQNEMYQSFRLMTREVVLPEYYEDEWKFPKDSVSKYFPDARDWSCDDIYASEGFSEYGILPYHLVVMQNRLTKAFAHKDLKRILRTAAEFGHYIGDAHVPLHTTENYNGQLTNQIGIHAFWESRVPELFAEDEYDFWVGQAEYIDDPSQFFWDMVLKSHSYVEEVLAKEWELRSTFPSDQQFCYDDRLGRTVLTQCQEFADAYQASLNGMIEDRMTASIKALGDCWYTAWVDAGQPNLDQLKRQIELTDEEKKEAQKLDEALRAGESIGRKHEN